MLFAAGAIQHINFLEIIRHPWFISAFIAAGSAQALKFIIASVRARRFVWRALSAAGGLPSGHSSLVSALSFAVGFMDFFTHI